MIRASLLILAFSTTSAYAQATTDGAINQNDDVRTAATDEAINAAAEAGVTGFVPLVAPALGVAAAAVGVAAAGSGSGSSNSTTSTVGTSN